MRCVPLWLGRSSGSPTACSASSSTPSSRLTLRKLGCRIGRDTNFLALAAAARAWHPQAQLHQFFITLPVSNSCAKQHDTSM